MQYFSIVLHWWVLLLLPFFIYPSLYFHSFTISLYWQVLTKKFVRVLSQRVSQSTVAPECQRCQCIGGATEMKLKCRSCSLSFEGSRAEEAGQVHHQLTSTELHLSSSPGTTTQASDCYTIQYCCCILIFFLVIVSVEFDFYSDCTSL